MTRRPGSPATVVEPTPPARVARAFRRLRAASIRNSARGLFERARLRVALILICSAIFWTGLYLLFAESFRFLDKILPLSNEIVEYVFSLFFLSLMVMLVFSTGIILFTSLFQSREAAYLLTGPAGEDRIFAHQFQEAIAFSSWGFFLLASPMLIAYGVTVGVPWPFYALFAGYLVGFVLIPGALGAIGAILVANLLPRRKYAALGGAVAVLVLAATLLGVRLWRTPGETLSREWLDALLGRLAFSQNPLLPSRWMSGGLLETARGNWRDGLFYLYIMAANAGFAYLLAAVVARTLYRRGYSRIQGGRSSRKRVGWYGFDAAFHRVFGPVISRPVRLLILKDIRTFRRDPAQWSQFLIFFSLLAFYFGNIPRLGYQIESAYFRNILSFLNLSVTALILSTFTSRFIFPMLSLEGRNFWVLGLLPLRRDAVLWGKFAFSSGISLLATEALVVLSDVMLRLSPAMIGLHMGMVAILCFGLSAISVGLGAKMPNLKEEDPSKIAAGFGGTLNLLVSLIFIVLVVGAVAIPCHLYLSARQLDDLGVTAFTDPALRRRVLGALVVCVVLGLMATLIPMRIGLKAFREMEF